MAIPICYHRNLSQVLVQCINDIEEQNPAFQFTFPIPRTTKGIPCKDNGDRNKKLSLKLIMEKSRPRKILKLLLYVNSRTVS